MRPRQTHTATLLDKQSVHTGLIGFDAEMEAETCDRSGADSLNGARATTADEQYALAA
jgi:hypothetical protein